MAVGVVGLTPQDADSLPLVDLHRFVQARLAYDNRLQKAEWERVRLLGYWAMSPYFPKAGAPKNPQDFCPFEWDSSTPNRQKPAYRKMEDLPEHMRKQIEKWNTRDNDE